MIALDGALLLHRPLKDWYMIRLKVCVCAAVLSQLCGCASNVDVSPSRAISQDINATHQLGPTSLRPGQSKTEGTIEPPPWRLEERQQ
jgi:hypothetical protein